MQLGCAQAQSGDKGVINAEQVQGMLDDSSTLILDVRTTGEFNRGHIPGALNIPVQNLSSSLGQLDKSKHIIVYCRSGNRSTLAKRILHENGYNQISNFKGSWNHWYRKGYPVQRAGNILN